MMGSNYLLSLTAQIIKITPADKDVNLRSAQLLTVMNKANRGKAEWSDSFWQT